METFKVSQFSCFSLQVRKLKPTRLNDLTWPWSPSLAKLGLGPKFSDLQGSLCHPLLILSSEFSEIIALSFLPPYLRCVHAYTHMSMHTLSRSVVANSLCPRGRKPARLLCPWDSPGKSTRVGYHALLQEIFPTERLNPSLLCLLHCRWILYLLSHLGRPLLFCSLA